MASINSGSNPREEDVLSDNSSSDEQENKLPKQELADLLNLETEESKSE